METAKRLEGIEIPKVTTEFKTEKEVEEKIEEMKKALEEELEKVLNSSFDNISSENLQNLKNDFFSNEYFEKIKHIEDKKLWREIHDQWFELSQEFFKLHLNNFAKKTGASSHPSLFPREPSIVPTPKQFCFILSIPLFYRKRFLSVEIFISCMEEECIFCDFVSGKWKKHRNKYRFEVLHETDRTISFLSIDFPNPAKEHILIIPKEHCVNLEDCPKKTLHELIEHASLASKAIRLEHEGCNILLNDGRSAEQTIIHTHFHLVPRDNGDNIEIELWDRTNISQKEYTKLNKKVKQSFKKTLRILKKHKTK